MFVENGKNFSGINYSECNILWLYSLKNPVTTRGCGVKLFAEIDLRY